MPQRLLKIRVRPARSAVLIAQNAADTDLLMAVKFFSGLWGGRFSQLLAVDPQASDPLTLFRLRQSRPEHVYGIGLDDNHWRRAVGDACQPRGYGPLTTEYVEGFKDDSIEDHTTVDFPLVHQSRTRVRKARDTRKLMLVATPANAPFATVATAMYGVHYPKLRQEYRDGVLNYAADSGAALVDGFTEFTKHHYQSWLDVTGYGLNRHLTEFAPVVPTIVLVEQTVADLALFWNLRAASATEFPSGVVPMPWADATSETTLAALVKWVSARLEYGNTFNYCQVTSATVDTARGDEFATKLRDALRNTPVQAVDFHPPRNRLPVVVASEYETTWQAECRGRKVKFLTPRPKLFEGMGRTRAWMVDVRDETGSGRAVLDTSYPASQVTMDLLNAPSPPSFPSSRIPRLGATEKYLTVRCYDRDPEIKLHLPDASELVEEVLREYEFEPQPDEKRNCYLPAIKRFGGFWRAAKAFTGTSRAILTALKDQAKSLHEIKGECKLGNRAISGKSYLEEIEPFVTHGPERFKRVGRQRATHYARRNSPENLKPATVVEFWADRGVLVREWQLGQCKRCGQKSSLPRLRIDRPVVCTACGSRLTLPEKVALGYSLHPTVRRAVQEGLIPVVLTARFLYRMTHDGFLWLPGIKYNYAAGAGDIDLVACCDGHLVFCECKDLDGVKDDAAVWSEVTSQFVQTAKTAANCKADLAVLASRAERYPQQLVDAVAEAVTDIPTLLLTASDLEEGERKLGTTFGETLQLPDLLHDPCPEPARRPTTDGIARQAGFGWGF